MPVWSAPATRVTSAKIIIAGGPTTPKETIIGSVSEITPLTTEAIMKAGTGEGHRPLPVHMDFGRVTVDRDLILYLFSTPSETTYWFMWEELVRGAIGAIVLVDTTRLADCFATVDFFESRRLPYLIAMNSFDGMIYVNAQDVRDALAISNDVPIVSTDVRNRESVKHVIISLIEYVLTARRAQAIPPR
ncbi:GTP-binding protein [Paractinoplanes durhamensis]|uniref:GTP-binding protein n=1 Tax=Paractinoplanes durhamensis TaxID=113563 RepID=UPI0036371366